jgi:hypothetical protein
MTGRGASRAHSDSTGQNLPDLVTGALEVNGRRAHGLDRLGEEF